MIDKSPIPGAVKRYDMKQAAQYLQISPWTLRMWFSERKTDPTRRVPDHIRIGRLYQFSKEDLDRFIEEGKVVYPKNFDENPGF